LARSPVPATGAFGNFTGTITSSFVYPSGSSFGFNQSHLYQHPNHGGISTDSASRRGIFNNVVSLFNMTNTVYNGVSGSQQADDASSL